MQLFYCKIVWLWISPNFCDSWICKGNDCKEVLYEQQMWIIWEVTFFFFCSSFEWYSKERTLLRWFHRGKNWQWLPFAHLHTGFFQIWYGNRHYWALQFDTSLDDLEFHSGSQLCKKAKTSVCIFSQTWVKFNVLPWPAGLLKSMLNLFCVVNVEGREPRTGDNINYTLNIAHIYIYCLFVFLTGYDDQHD